MTVVECKRCSGVKGVWFEVSGVKVAWCKMGVV